MQSLVNSDNIGTSSLWPSSYHINRLGRVLNGVRTSLPSYIVALRRKYIIYIHTNNEKGSCRIESRSSLHWWRAVGPNHRDQSATRSYPMPVGRSEKLISQTGTKHPCLQALSHTCRFRAYTSMRSRACLWTEHIHCDSLLYSYCHWVVVWKG